MTAADLRAITEPVGWLRFSPIRVISTNRGVRVRVAWKPALAALIILPLLGWLGFATTAYLFVKYGRGFSEVQFSHMLFYPTQREAYRKARGDFLIEQAKIALKEEEFQRAYHSLNVGFGMSPDNRDGRMLLAQFQVIRKRPDLAQQLLVGGLDKHSDDREYLQTLFSFLLQRQEDFELLRITGDLIARAGLSPKIDERLRLTAMARATAQFFRGNYDAAEDTLREFRLGDSTDGKILAVRIDWERGDREAAFNRLEELSEASPENEQVYTQYASYLRESGRDDDLRRLALLRQLSYPNRPRARIDLLYLFDKAGDEPSVEAGIADIFRDFSTNSDVMLALADFAANTGRPTLARRIYDHCKASDLPWEGAALMTVEAHIVAKQYREALETTTQMQKENPEWGKRFYAVFNGLQAIANYGLSDVEAAQLFLANFLDQSGVRADNLVAVSNRLVSVGANEEARQVLSRAVRADPLNQTALTGLIRLDLEAGLTDTAPKHLHTLLAMRKPPRALLREAYNKLASDRFMFTPGRAAVLEELQKTLNSSAVTPSAS